MDTVLRLLCFTTLGLAWVLLLRKPARRLFGAGAACTLWVLPVLFAIGSAWPWPVGIALGPVVAIGDAAASWPGPTIALPPDAWSIHILELLWAAGALGWLLRLARHYRHLLRGCRSVPASMLAALAPALGALDPRCLFLHEAGPAVLWAPRARLLLPADMLDRFGADQRRQILRHEQAHLRRGDALWSLLAEIAFALLWFHPLAWFALPRFRTDRELACDERVLREAPDEAAGYARALLDSATMPASPALIPWLTEPQLKERLIMIQRTPPTSLRRHLGLLAAGLLAAAGTLAAQAYGQDTDAHQDLAHNAQVYPHYPAASISNHEQGTVMLKVKVGVDGRPLAIEYEPEHSTTTSANLIAAASSTVMQWRFTPATHQGKAVAGYVRVPVLFTMKKLSEPSADANPGHA
jgi:TonB family protein